MKKLLLALALTLEINVTYAQENFLPHTWGDWQTWGDQNDGTFLNPVIPADFSDIDCIRHDGYYYAISSTFQFEPGMVILRSSDMVNWHVYSHAVADITQISEAQNWSQMKRYARGIWAGAIRYHNHRFYIYFGCPDEGMFMTSARKIEGPWEPLTKMNIGGGWDDCCPLFDDDGHNYFVATHYSDGYKTYMFHLSADGKSVDWDSRVLINEGYGREANKLYKWNGLYYHLFSEHRDDGRYLMMQRAKHPMGPYTESHRLCYTQSEWYEPNQGGYLQDDAGNWFFLTHHGKGDWGGREVSLLPVTWTKDGWPIIGEPDKDNIGRMVWRNAMPGTTARKTQKTTHHITHFTAEDWEWNYHPRKDFFKRTKQSLTLKAFKPLQENNLLKAGNTITLRAQQTPWNEARVRLDITKMVEGQRSGICHFSSAWSEFGIKMNDGRKQLYYRANNKTENEVLDASTLSTIWLRSTWGLDAQCHYAYSTDGKEWHEAYAGYTLQWGNYRGDRLGLFTYNNLGEAGQATFTDFSYISTDRLPEAAALHNPFGNFLVPDMIADASIQLIGDTFYCYATTDGYGHGLDTSGPPVVWKSKDFVHWNFEGTYFPQCDYEKYWAPSKAIRSKQGKWFIYPTVNGFMYPCVADSPDGPFSIAKGNSFTTANRLWEKDNVHAIDTEIFIDDDGTPYAFWCRRNVARLKPDMITIDTIFPAIHTRRTEYSEGPIFFKRNGIYYYLYTIGGDEKYEYYYQMSRTSPIGPWESPNHDLVCTTSYEQGVFGPGHGCVFADNDGQYYLAFLEFGRRSTNRMTYVNRMNFNDDGTIKQVEVNLDGVGYLRPNDHPVEIRPQHITASSEAQHHLIRENKDSRCRRTELFSAAFAIDGANGSRWMAADHDTRPTLTIDLGTPTKVGSSEIAFVRPTAGHAYVLEGSTDGSNWTRIGGHDDCQKRSPHTDHLGGIYRYLRITVTLGIKGVYEWKLYQ
jgi:beta-xylosidase